jgi:hypothetical protein
MNTATSNNIMLPNYMRTVNRISPKENSGANGKFLPKPLLFHLRHPNSKTDGPKFWQTLVSPKNSFAKTSSALFRHLPEYLEGRTPKEKHPFLFQKEFHPAKSEMHGVFFLSGLPRLCEAVAERYERTRQFRATTRSARAISRHQGCFQNTFELCIIHTAKKRNRILEPKWGRAEGATLMYSPRQIQNPKGFSTLRVARRLPIQNYD